MHTIELYIDKRRNKVLANQYGSFKFYLNKIGSGPGFHSKFSFTINPFQTSQDYQTILIEFDESLNRFDTIIKQRFIYEAFKNGIEKFINNLKSNGFYLSNSIRISITNYEPYNVDSKPICNEICIEQALNQIYLGIELDKRTVFEIVYLEYDTIYFSDIKPESIKINNRIINWGIPLNLFKKEIGIENSNKTKHSQPKNFTGSKSLIYSNTILNKAFYFEAGFDHEDRFIELSSQIGFELSINGMSLKYMDSIDMFREKAKKLNYNFTNNDNGNFHCNELGLILSESAHENNKLGNGFLEYIYITKPKGPNNK